MNFKWSSARAWNLVLLNRVVDFAHFLQADLYDSLYFTCKNSLSSGQYVNHKSIFWFTEEQCGYHGNQWPKPIFATPLHLPTKFGANRSINSGEEGCENYTMFSCWNVAWKQVFRAFSNFLDSNVVIMETNGLFNSSRGSSTFPPSLVPLGP